MSVLEVHQLSKHYGSRKAVDNIGFALQPGEVVGFLGPNGAGKTTTMRMICGLIRPSAGHVRLLEQTVPGPSLQQLGAMIEEPSFYPYLSGRDNLRYAAGYHGGLPANRVDEVLGLVGLDKRADDTVRKYSQGMRQRLGLARALLAKPKVLILDEPANGLDPEGVAELRAVIRSFGEQGLSVLVSSHILAEVEKFADRVLIIESGRLLADGPLHDLLHRLGAADATYFLETSEPVRALEVLGREAWVSRVQAVPGGIHLVIPQSAAYRLAPLLVAAGVPVIQLAKSTHNDNLEDLYLRVLKGHSSKNATESAAGGFHA